MSKSDYDSLLLRLNVAMGAINDADQKLHPPSMMPHLSEMTFTAAALLHELRKDNGKSQ